MVIIKNIIILKGTKGKNLHLKRTHTIIFTETIESIKK